MSTPGGTDAASCAAHALPSSTGKGSEQQRPQHGGGKRQRTDQRADTGYGPILQPHCLLKHTLELPGPGTLSPGSLSSTKVAIAAPDADGQCTVFIGDACSLHSASLRLPTEAEVETGKEGVLVPTQAQGVVVRQVDEEPLHGAEVQHVQLAGCLLASVDASGQAVLRMPGSDGERWRHLHLDAPPRRDCGWAGLSFCPGSGSGGASFGAADSMDAVQTAVARHFARDVLLYQGARCVRTLHTVQAPTALHYLPQLPNSNTNLLALAEEHQVSLWDVRAGEAGGCVERIPMALGCPLYALDWCGAEGGLLGTAGADRAVTLLEPRKWRPLHKWPSCVKYTIHALRFSTLNPHYAWLASLDYECLAGRWDGSTGKGTGNTSSMTGGASRAVGARGMHLLGDDEMAPLVQGGLSFRGNSRWLGMARAEGADALAALSLTGQLYVWQAKAAEHALQA